VRPWRRRRAFPRHSGLACKLAEERGVLRSIATACNHGEVPYPGRKVHDVLPEFIGTNVIKPTEEQRARLVEYVAAEYRAGRSLRELGELTGRTQTAVRRALDAAGVRRRGRGAQPQATPTGNPAQGNLIQ
jgi:hypothetical protein